MGDFATLNAEAGTIICDGKYLSITCGYFTLVADANWTLPFAPMSCYIMVCSSPVGQTITAMGEDNFIAQYYTAGGDITLPKTIIYAHPKQGA